jgi:hypothetical protein
MDCRSGLDRRCASLIRMCSAWSVSILSQYSDPAARARINGLCHPISSMIRPPVSYGASKAYWLGLPIRLTVCDLLRIGIKQIIIAAAKTNNQRQKRDAPERAEQIVTPHFRQSDWKRECVLKIELAIIIESPGPLARKIAQDGLDRRYFTPCGCKENPDASGDGRLVCFQ